MKDRKKTEKLFFQIQKIKMSPSLWLLIIGTLLQLAGIIAYFFNREKAPLPWWIPALFLGGWILILIGVFYVYSEQSKFPGSDILSRFLPQQGSDT